jgi:hypothetical protein
MCVQARVSVRVNHLQQIPRTAYENACAYMRKCARQSFAADLEDGI